jgi:hypothetical protein
MLTTLLALWTIGFIIIIINSIKVEAIEGVVFGIAGIIVYYWVMLSIKPEEEESPKESQKHNI